MAAFRMDIKVANILLLQKQRNKTIILATTELIGGRHRPGRGKIRLRAATLPDT